MAWSFPIFCLCVALSKSMCIFTFSPSSSPCNNSTVLLTHSSFLLCSLGCPILFKNGLVSMSFGCCYVFMQYPLTCCRNIFSFWNFVFCLYFTLSQYPFSSFWFISLSCIGSFTSFFIFVHHVSAFFFCFIIFACRRNFFICVSSGIAQPGIHFLLVFFR